MRRIKNIAKNVVRNVRRVAKTSAKFARGKKSLGTLKRKNYADIIITRTAKFANLNAKFANEIEKRTSRRFFFSRISIPSGFCDCES